MSRQLLLPASGTVRFLVWNYEDNDYMPKMFDFEGNTEWVRPVVGLVFGSWWGGSPNPLERSAYDKTLMTHPLVVNELGEVCEVHDYLESLLGEEHWDHATCFFEPHISGPVTNAPIVHRLDVWFCPCGCTKQVKRGLECTGEPVEADRQVSK